MCVGRAFGVIHSFKICQPGYFQSDDVHDVEQMAIAKGPCLYEMHKHEHGREDDSIA